MEQDIGIRELDEWIYGLTKVASDIEPGDHAEALKILSTTMDRMREIRSELKLRRHNQVGY